MKINHYLPRRDWLAISLLFVSSLLFFGPVLRPPTETMIFGADLERLFRATSHFAFESFRQGDFPLWNPHLFLGFPHYAEPQLSTFYPPMWLAAALPPATAFALLYAFHLGLMAAGGYVLIRQLKGGVAGALAGGFTLANSSFVVAHVYAGHLPHLMTLAYLPWLLAASHWAWHRPSWATTVIAGVPLGLAMLAGYAPFFLLLVIAVTLWIGWLAVLSWREDRWRSVWRAGAQWVGLGLFAGLLAAIQLLPTFEFTLYSSRLARADYAFATTFSLPFWSLLTLLMPDLFGAPKGDVAYWAAAPIDAYWEFAIYVGILPLLLFGLAWISGTRSRFFWLLLAVGGLLFALGPATGVYHLLLSAVPSLGLFRVPARMSYLWSLSVAVLSGLMVDMWLTRPAAARETFIAPLKKMALVLMCLLLSVALFFVFWQAMSESSLGAVRVTGVINQTVRLLLLAGASILLLISDLRRPTVWVAAALLILLVDLWGHGSKLITLSSDSDIAWVMADLALPPERDTYRVLTEGLSNDGLRYGFYNVEGYDDFRTESSVTLGKLALGHANLSRLLGVRYLLLPPEAPPSSVPGWQILTQPVGVTIYERTDAQPRAFVVHEVLAAADPAEALRLLQMPDVDLTRSAIVQVIPDTSCTIAMEAGVDQVSVVSYRPQEVIIETTTAANGWLVLTDLHYPGWQATIDDETVPIQPTNYGLRGLCLPAGTHQVRFQFRPSILRYGLLATALALGILVVAVVQFWRSGHHLTERQGAGGTQ